MIILYWLVSELWILQLVLLCFQTKAPFGWQNFGWNWLKNTVLTELRKILFRLKKQAEQIEYGVSRTGRTSIHPAIKTYCTLKLFKRRKQLAVVHLIQGTFSYIWAANLFFFLTKTLESNKGTLNDNSSKDGYHILCNNHAHTPILTVLSRK